jgi:hypothetical protein
VPCNNRNPIPEQRKNVAEKLNQAMQIMMNASFGWLVAGADLL